MGLLNELTHGRRGLRLALPGRFEIQSDEQNDATLVDAGRQAGLFLFQFPLQLDLRPEHEGLLSRDIERHARELFDLHFVHRHGQQPPGADASRRRPRTEDPDWSPVLSIERVRLGACEALSVVHRNALEHGLEIVMGHLLVPLSSGLFEFRVVARNRGPTGVRESDIVARAMMEEKVKTQAEMEALMMRLTPDDPRHDSRYPDHPLTVVRDLLRMLAAPGVIEVSQPAPVPPAGEVVLPGLGSAVTLPPRYVQTANSEPTFAQFSRVAFAGGVPGSDGVQLLSLLMVAEKGSPEGPERQKMFAAKARELAQSTARGATGVHIETWTSASKGGGVQAFAHAEFQPGAQGVPRQSTLVCLTDAGDVVKVVVLRTSACIPREELLADVETVTRSWRPLKGTGVPPPAPVTPPPAQKKKKWWWF
jgi:hypothetical protein